MVWFSSKLGVLFSLLVSNVFFFFATKRKMEEKKTSFLELNVDCCEEMFQFLSVEDLINLGNTCKRMNNLVGFFISQYRRCLKFVALADGLFFKPHRGSERKKINADHLAKHIPWVLVNSNHCIGQILTCARLQTIEFQNVCLSKENIATIAPVLRNVTNAVFVNTYIGGGITSFLQRCPKIQRVAIIAKTNT